MCAGFFADRTAFPPDNLKKNNELVLLFYPEDSDLADMTASPIGRSIPIDLLAVAGPLDNAGYDVRIVAANTEPDYMDRILEAAGEAVCLGMTVAIGRQVSCALEVSKVIKDRFPGLPIVWGGWFPTMTPEVVIADPNVDIIVRGQGERTMLELVDKLSSGLPLDGVLGISFSRNGKVVTNPDRPVEDINLFPPYPFHLFDKEKILRKIDRKNETARPSLIYNSSRGCPHSCTFCSSKRAYNRRWTGLKPDRVVNELKKLTEGYDGVFIRIMEASFFTNKKRVREIASLLIERGLAERIEWASSGCVEDLVRLDDDALALMKRSGCRNIGIGVESGSPEVLSLFRKRTSPESSLMLSKRLEKHGIHMLLFFIVGIPGEPPDALKKTLDLATDMYHANPDTAVIDTLFYQPLPGTVLATRPAVKAFYREPRTLEEWSVKELYGFPFSRVFKKSYTRELERFHFYLKMGRILDKMARRRSWFFSGVWRMLWRIAVFRMRFRSAMISPEFHLYSLMKGMLPGRKMSQAIQSKGTPIPPPSEADQEVSREAPSDIA